MTRHCVPDGKILTVADEGDWLELLIASERTSDWLNQLRRGTSQQKLQAAKGLYAEIRKREAYIEEAKAAGAIDVLTKLLAKSDNEELLELAAAILSTCSGSQASGAKVQEVRYGPHVVRIQEGALGDGLGARIWIAAHCLCRYLVDQPEVIQGQKVLELGSGCGLSGLLAAKLGAQQVVLTDYEHAVLLNLQKCVLQNYDDALNQTSGDQIQGEALTQHPGLPAAREGSEEGTFPRVHPANGICWTMGNVRVRRYNWADALPADQKMAILKEDQIAGFAPDADGPPDLEIEEQFSVIIGSDLIYELYHADMVAAVLVQRLTPLGRAYIAMAVRRQALLDRLMEQAALQGLQVQAEEQELDPEAVGIVGREKEYEGGFVLLTLGFSL